MFIDLWRRSTVNFVIILRIFPSEINISPVIYQIVLQSLISPNCRESNYKFFVPMSRDLESTIECTEVLVGPLIRTERGDRERHCSDTGQHWGEQLLKLFRRINSCKLGQWCTLTMPPNNSMRFALIIRWSQLHIQWVKADKVLWIWLSGFRVNGEVDNA